MIVTKSKFQIMFGFKDLSSVSHLLKKGTLIADNSGMIDLENKQNKKWTKTRTAKLLQKEAIQSEDKKSYLAKKYKNKYVAMSTEHLFKSNLSLKAKGLMSLLLTKNCECSLEGLVSICKESRDSIRSALEELQNFGYLSVIKERNTKGQFNVIYNVYESPSENPYLLKN